MYVKEQIQEDPRGIVVHLDRIINQKYVTLGSGQASDSVIPASTLAHDVLVGTFELGCKEWGPRMVTIYSMTPCAQRNTPWHDVLQMMAAAPAIASTCRKKSVGLLHFMAPQICQVGRITLTLNKPISGRLVHAFRHGRNPPRTGADLKTDWKAQLVALGAKVS